MDKSNRPKYFWNVYPQKNGELIEQGYLYFFLEEPNEILFGKNLLEPIKVISVCQSESLSDKKLHLFKSPKHEKNFVGTNVFKSDNYKVIHDQNGIIVLDNVILPLQSRKRESI